jgi:hypothetical protein
MKRGDEICFDDQFVLKREDEKKSFGDPVFTTKAYGRVFGEVRKR